MKLRNLIIVTILLSVVFSSCDEDDVTVIGNWVTKAWYEGYPRANGVSFEIKDFGYWGLGRDDDGYLTDFWKYDPDKNAWSEVKSFPGTPRAFNFSVSNSSKGFMGLGYDGNNDLEDFWEYNPETNEWNQLENFPGGTRRYPAAFAIGDDVFVGSGSQDNDKKFTNDFFKFSNGQWSKITALSGEKRRSANAIGFNGKGYLISGYRTSLLQDFWEYDPAADIWTQLAKLNDEDNGGNSAIARYNASLFASESKLYLVGGNATGASLKTIFEWDPTSKVWTQKTDIEAGVSREGAGAFMLKGYGYVVGGRSGTRYLDDLYKFEPSVEKNLDDN